MRAISASGGGALLALILIPGSALAGVPALTGIADLEREEFDDGTFVYVLPPADFAPADFEEGGITWRYDGQEVLTDRVDDSRGDFSQGNGSAPSGDFLTAIAQVASGLVA